jgi:hypothetical protein
LGVSRSVNKNPTKQQIAGNAKAPKAAATNGVQKTKRAAARRRKSAPVHIHQLKLRDLFNKLMILKVPGLVTEEQLDRFVYERLFQRPKNPYTPEMPKNFYFDPNWLHKCEDCGDS